MFTTLMTISWNKKQNLIKLHRETKSTKYSWRFHYLPSIIGSTNRLKISKHIENVTTNIKQLDIINTVIEHTTNKRSISNIYRTFAKIDYILGHKTSLINIISLKSCNETKNQNKEEISVFKLFKRKMRVFCMNKNVHNILIFMECH